MSESGVGERPGGEPADARTADERPAGEPVDERPGEERRVAPARRPLLERLGLFAIAIVLAAMFGGVAVALLAGGELFLGIMAAIGAGMTLWVGGLTLLRG